MALPSKGEISVRSILAEMKQSQTRTVSIATLASEWSSRTRRAKFKSSSYQLSDWYGEAYTSPVTLSIFPMFRFIPYLGQEFTITVTCNTSWKVRSLGGAVVSKTSGSGNGSFSVDVFRNYSNNRKMGSIEVSAGGQSVSFQWRQEEYDACFSPDTPILYPDGKFKELKDVKVGDELMSYRLEGLLDESVLGWDKWKGDAKKGGLSTAKVVRVDKGIHKDYYLLNNLIKVTYEHLMLVKRDGEHQFIRAENIKVGDLFFDINGNDVEVISKELIQKTEEFISMDVEELDVYFAHNILVHNAAINKNEGLRPALSR